MKKKYIYVVRVHGDFANGLIADTDRGTLGDWFSQHDGTLFLCNSKTEANEKARELNEMYKEQGTYLYDMMTKDTRKNVQKYIIEHFTPEDYTDEKFFDFKNIAKFIMNIFHKERYNDNQDYIYYEDCGGECAAFKDWCMGLPSVLDTCYFYNRSAIKDYQQVIGDKYGETSGYDEQEAETVLTNLIYQELKRAERGI